MGLFQVAYFDIATATLPKENRGVAGSLVLMTRTVGIVMGASVLTLAFRALSDAAGGTGACRIAGRLQRRLRHRRQHLAAGRRAGTAPRLGWAGADRVKCDETAIESRTPSRPREGGDPVCRSDGHAVGEH